MGQYWIVPCVFLYCIYFILNEPLYGRGFVNFLHAVYKSSLCGSDKSHTKFYHGA